MSYSAVEEIYFICKKYNINFYEAILLDDCNERGVSREESEEKMMTMWKAMIDSIKAYDRNSVSVSGLVGKEGGLMEDYLNKGESLCGDFVSKVIMRALQMGGSNACMKRVVAAPTAGACGVLPAVYTSLQEELNIEDSEMVKALYISAGIGQVIASRAFISGAAGGCQAEVGSASAMAAAGLVYLKGGTNEQMGNASAIALKNLLGLVCDPVAGLVEIPCVKRNVIGAVNALTAADMSLAGINSIIPVDQVIDAMRAVGESMDASLRETSYGGLASTPKGKEIVNQMRQKHSRKM